MRINEERRGTNVDSYFFDFSNWVDGDAIY